MKLKKNNMLSERINDIDHEIEEIIFRLKPTEDRLQLLKQISKDFREKRRVTDYQIDHVFPQDVAKKSHPHWTPSEVATRALELLDTNDKSNVLDVGSGCGKFCIIAGLYSKGNFVGIEHRKHLFDIAQQIANDFQVTNVSFVHGDLRNIDWTIYNCFYLFNPFYENVMGPSFWIDDTLPINEDLFETYVKSVIDKLKTVKIGTRVVTYHGFGGNFPPDFICMIKEFIWSGPLELWVKVHPDQILQN